MNNDKDIGGSISMSESVAFETIKHSGFEWVKPNQKVNDILLYRPHEFQGVSIQSSCGVLVLARVEEFTKYGNSGLNLVGALYGGVRRKLVLASELNNLDS